MRDQPRRQELLETLGEAIDEVGVAIAALGSAYEQLDERSADKLEETLFAPLQKAYGRAKRTHAGFAQRHDLESRAFESSPAGLPSTGVKGFVEAARESAGEADAILADLQDSMLPVEFGDPELRSGLAEVRELVGVVPEAAQGFLRSFGR